jgi:hypothetical protein
MAERQFLLYSTGSCHLCEQAEALLQTLVLPEPVMLDVVDISDDDALVQRYGTRIPVLARVSEQGEGTAELGWPFDAATATAFLQR